MTTRHKVLMSMPPAPRSVAFYANLAPPDFELVWVEDWEADAASVAPIIQDVEFAYVGIPPKSWLPLMPRLKLIQQMGVGYKDTDVQAARERGVPYAIAPEGTCVGTAEHVILLILAVYKHLAEAHQTLKEGDWSVKTRRRYDCRLFYGKVLGIVGLGRIGREVAQRARGFEPARMVYNDIARKSPEEEKVLGVEFLPLEELLQVSDIVTLHVFLSEESQGMIGEQELGMMKPSAILINASRGEVIDEEALYRALRERCIWGAGIDVWTQEPTPPDNPILQLDNAICTPHMSSGSSDADRLKFEAGIANFRRVLRGEEPINVVRPYAEMATEATPS